MTPPDDQSPAHWSESPWYWFFLFATMALPALALIGPKHIERQQRLVRMQQAREKAAAARAAGQSSPLDAGQGEKLSSDQAPADELEQPVVSVLPLMSFLVLLAAVIGTGLFMTTRRRASRLSAAEKPPP